MTPQLSHQKKAKPTTFIQPKLMVNAPNDVYEQEADAVADRVMRMPLVSSKAQGTQGMLASSIQRKCAHCEAEEKKKMPIMRKAESVGGFETSPQFSSQLSNTRSGGHALPTDTQSFMENRFGRDFSHVRLHTDGTAATMSAGIQAKAFTHGSDIYFNQGQYSPNTEGGKRLLAHELTHVVQQGNNLKQQLHRSTSFTPGRVNEVMNMAEQKLALKPYGLTALVLNSTAIKTGNGIAEAKASIKKPTISFKPVAAGGVGAKVDTVAVNAGSFEENVLTRGPWSKTTTKGEVKAVLSNMPASCTGTDATDFTAKGKPTDADMYTKNRKHEDYHAADYKVVFNNNIVPWDVKLTQAKTAGTVFQGADNAAAETALNNAMGGTPDDIAEALAIALIASNNTYHATPNGRGIIWSDEAANTDCSICSAKGTNPA